MRSPLLAILAISVMIFAVIPIQESDADAPVRLYFFDDDDKCIAEVVLMPGEPLNSADMPYHGNYKKWYDDTGRIVNGGSTFESGDYIIKAYDDAHAPVRPQTEIDNGPHYNIPVIAGVIAVLAAMVLAYCLIKRR